MFRFSINRPRPNLLLIHRPHPNLLLNQLHLQLLLNCHHKLAH